MLSVLCLFLGGESSVYSRSWLAASVYFPPHLTSLRPFVQPASSNHRHYSHPSLPHHDGDIRPPAPTTFDNLFLYSFARSPHSFLSFCRLGIAALISVHRQRLAQVSSVLISGFTVLLFTSRTVSSYLI